MIMHLDTISSSKITLIVSSTKGIYAVDQQTVLGLSPSSAAGKVAYAYRLNGPSLTVSGRQWYCFVNNKHSVYCVEIV